MPIRDWRFLKNAFKNFESFFLVRTKKFIKPSSLSDIIYLISLLHSQINTYIVFTLPEIIYIDDLLLHPERRHCRKNQ